MIDAGSFESSSIFDVNNDGIPDIACGGYWYENPGWKRHKICDVLAHGEYYDDLCNIPIDVNGDGNMDFVTGGWWGKTLAWRENPGESDTEWKTHNIDECGSIETARSWDVDGDGQPEIVPNTPEGPLVFYKLYRNHSDLLAAKFHRHQVWEGPSGHGLGFGDINGYGRGAFVVRSGWLEAPQNPLSDSWEFIKFEFDLGSASVPIIIADINKDGVQELVAGQAHNYGLDYYQQKYVGDKLQWTRHPIDPYQSQYHDLHCIDIDGDGDLEIVTGNRYRAHNGRDPGETDVVGLYCFKWNGESFTKQVIDYGKVPGSSGTGIQLSIADLNGDGRLDIAAPGKEGLFVFENLGS